MLEVWGATKVLNIMSLILHLNFSLTVNWETVWRANTKKKFRVHTNMNRNVGLLRIFPGITAAAVSDTT